MRKSSHRRPGTMYNKDMQAPLTMVRDEVQGDNIPMDYQTHDVEIQRARLQAQLQQLMMSMHHDVYLAMLKMRDYREFIYKHSLSCDTVRAFVVDIHAEASHVLHVLRDMVDLKQPEQQQLELCREWLNINTLIIDAVQQKRLELSHSHIQLRLARALPIVIGDRAKLMQAITSLLDLACERLVAEGNVTVSSRIKNRLLHVRIQASARIVRSVVPTHGVFPVNLDVPPGEEDDRLRIAHENILLHGGQLWIDRAFNRDVAWHFTLCCSKELFEQRIAVE